MEKEYNSGTCNIHKGYDSLPPSRKGSSLPLDPTKINLILLDLLQKEEVEVEINNCWITGKEALKFPYKKLSGKNTTYRTTDKGRECLKEMGAMRC